MLGWNLTNLFFTSLYWDRTSLGLHQAGKDEHGKLGPWILVLRCPSSSRVSIPLPTPATQTGGSRESCSSCETQLCSYRRETK